MNDRHMGRSAVNPKGGQMEPNRGNSPACRKTQRRDISRNIYLHVCPQYGRHNKARRNYPYKEPTIHIRMKMRARRYGRDNRHNDG